MIKGRGRRLRKEKGLCVEKRKCRLWWLEEFQRAARPWRPSLRHIAVSNWGWQNPKLSTWNTCPCRSEGPSAQGWREPVTLGKAPCCSVLLSASTTQDCQKLGTTKADRWRAWVGGYSKKQQSFNLSSDSHKPLTWSPEQNWSLTLRNYNSLVLATKP